MYDNNKQGRRRGHIPPASTQLHDLHQRAGIIPEAQSDSIEDEYRCFLSSVNKESKRELNSSGDFSSKEEEIYSKNCRIESMLTPSRICWHLRLAKLSSKQHQKVFLFGIHYLEL